MFLRRLQRPASRQLESSRLATTHVPKQLHPPQNNVSRPSFQLLGIPKRAAFATRSDASGRFGRYQDEYNESLHDVRRYWLWAMSDLDWHTEPTFENALCPHPKSDRMHQWFADGVINTCYNCLDWHVKTRPDQRALVYDSPVTNVQGHYMYAELLDEVS